MTLYHVNQALKILMIMRYSYQQLPKETINQYCHLYWAACIELLLLGLPLDGIIHSIKLHL